MPNFGTSTGSNVPIKGPGSKGSQTLFKAKLLLLFAVAFFFGEDRSYVEKIGKIHYR